MQNPKNLSTDIFNIDKNIENYLDWPVTEDHFNVIIDIIIKNFFIILNKKKYIIFFGFCISCLFISFFVVYLLVFCCFES